LSFAALKNGGKKTAGYENIGISGRYIWENGRAFFEWEFGWQQGG
jgi:hypothetical protein